MKISDAAVEAAARTYADLLSRKGHPGWEELGKYGDYARQLRLDNMRIALEAAAPHLMAAAVERARSNNDHIEPGSGAYGSGFHYALDCVYLEDDPAGAGE